MRFHGAPHNPFVAARFAPGQLPWFGDELEWLCSRALVPGARHQIVGPHGSGKSSLLALLEARALSASFRVTRVRGSEGFAPERFATRGPRELWLVDEYEELSAWARLRLAAARARTRPALVVTAHHDIGYASLRLGAVTPETAELVVRQLVSGRDWPAPERPRLAAALARHRGNLREVLFELYDEVERVHRDWSSGVDAAE